MTTPTLHHVRYHGTYYHPAFFRGRGWRGWLIRVLNAARWALETAAQRLVLDDFVVRVGLPLGHPRRRAMVAEFWGAVRTERAVVGGWAPPAGLPAPPPRDSTTQPTRPLPLDQLHARYAGRGRGAPRVVFEDEFEPRGPDDDKE